MSFYIVSSGASRERLQVITTELESPGKAAVVHPGGVGWTWVDDDPQRFGPADDAATGVHVVSSGRLVWPSGEWKRAERLPYRGGLANRLILDRFLNDGSDGVVPYNGSAAVAVIDPRDGRIHVWTDQFGYHPCFIYRAESADQCVVTTFPDLLLADRAASVTYDLNSMAEFLRGWRATPPHTYFREVKHVGAATHLIIDPRAMTVHTSEYWRPFETGFFPTIDTAAEDLAQAVEVAVGERTGVAKQPLFFISGGADSRVLLFSAADPARVTAVNLYERPGLESTIAERLCEVAGCRFVGLQRDSDFYPRHLMDTVRWSGAMWSAEDSHYIGFAEQVREFNPDLVMTACTTDWVFKGYGLEKRYRSLLGRNLPLLSYVNRRSKAFLPNVPLPAPPELATELESRLSHWFAGCPDELRTPRERLLVEDRRIRPAAYTVSVSGAVMYRIFPYDTFLADSRVAACYSRIHPDWKLNRELWGKTAARICSGAGTVVDSNWGWRVDASKAEKLAVFTRGWLARRFGRSRGGATIAAGNDRPPSSGSWPEYGWYALHSPTLQRLWQSVTAEERSRMSVISGFDPWQRPLADWARDGFHLFRILTLLAHWRQVDDRRRRARLARDDFFVHSFRERGSA